MDEKRATVSATPIRVFLVDDHKIFLWGLRRIIEQSPTPMTVVGEVSSINELLVQLPAAQPDVLILDLDLAGHDASADIPTIRSHSNVRILILTGETDPEAHYRLLFAGARGVVEKLEPSETILRAITRVHAGEVWARRDTVSRILGALTDRLGTVDPVVARIKSLTHRERQIVGEVVRHAGAKGAEIASSLGISESTLRNHLTLIYEKLEVRNRAEMILFANQHGLGSPPHSRRSTW